MSYLLGGLLTGVGEGMEKKAIYDRETALENLRNQNAVAADERKAGYTADRDERLHGQDLEKLGVSAALGEDQAEKNFGRDVKKMEIGATLDERLTRVRGDIDRSNTEASARLQSDLSAAEKAGTLADVGVGANGQYVITYKDGSQKISPLKAQEDPDVMRERERAERRNTTRGQARGVASASQPAAPHGDTPVLQSDAAVEQFLSNPQNKGKEFVGPDGQRYRF